MKTTRRQHTSGQRLFALLLAALLVFGLVPVTGVADSSGSGITTDGVRTDPNRINTVADPETLGRPQTIYGDNTLNAGKVTVGKSVSNSGITLEDALVNGNDLTVNLSDPDNFLVTISQSAQVMGLSTETNVPVDVVFVLDTSGSMSALTDMRGPKADGSNGTMNRSEAMVQVINDTIEALMELNSENRVGVVVFSAHNLGVYDTAGRADNNAAIELSPLASYSGEAATNHLTYGTGTVNWAGNVNTIHGRNASGGVSTAERYYIGGATNIQAGIAKGAEMLMNANLSQGNTRVPFLIVLSDGAPTVSSSNDDWWNPDQQRNQGNYTYADGNDAIEGNSFLTLLTAAYYKEKVSQHYTQYTGKENDLTVYTIGYGLETQNTDYEVQMSQMTLNPMDELKPGSGNFYQADISDAWDKYTNHEAFTIQVGPPNGYVQSSTITHDGLYYFYNSETTVSYNRNQQASLTNRRPNDVKYNETWVDVGNSVTYRDNIIDDIIPADKSLTALAYNDDYHDAKNASQLQEAFADLLIQISKKAISSPTHVGSTGEDFSGYVNFYDPIGEYMEVKDMKGIVADGYFYQGASAARHLASGTNADFNELIKKVLQTRMSMTGSSGVSVDEVLAAARASSNQAYYRSDTDYDNSIVWWGNSYNTNDEDPGVQVVGFAENDTIDYIERAKAAGNIIPAGADYVCRSYFFYGEAGGANQNPDHEYLYFVVRVQRSLTAPYQQTVVISAPASLLSMEKVLITEESNGTYTASVEEADPARVVYEVGLRSDITAENVEHIVSDAYKSETVNGEGSANYNATNDTYTFFTNDWDRSKSVDSHNRAMAHATFDAAADNAFYTYQENTLIVDASGKAVTSDPAGKTAYYVREYYEWGTRPNADGTYTATKKTKLIEVEIPSNANLVNEGGKWYIPKGAYTAATLVVNGDDTIKGDNPNTTTVEYDNKTGTSSIVAHPHRTGDSSNSHYTVYLGNNGKLTLKANTPKPTKTVHVNGSATDDNGKPVQIGDVLGYDISVVNSLNTTATYIIEDTVPAGTQFKEAADGGQYDPATGKITWEVDIPANTLDVVTFWVTVTKDALNASVVPGTIQNTATVEFPNNAKYTTNTTENPPYGKTVTDTNNNDIDGEHGYQVGDILTYHIRYHNNVKNSDGEYDVANITITDQIPAGTELVAGSISHGGQMDSNGKITWNLTNVRPNMAGVVTFRVKITAAAKVQVGTEEIYLPNTATIALGNDPVVTLTTNTTENWADVGDLVLTKEVVDTDKQNQENLEFTLTLTESTGKLNGTYTMTSSLSGNTSVVFKNGVAYANENATEPGITIAHNETLTIQNIPAGCKITVVETAMDGWTPSYNEKTTAQQVTIVANNAAMAAARVDVDNDYHAKPVSFQLQGTKTFAGANFPLNTTFTFRAQEYNYDEEKVVENGIVVTATATYRDRDDSSLSFAFSSREFTTEMDRYYLVTEVPSADPNMITDGTQYLLHLVVTDNDQGNLELTYTLFERAGDIWSQISTNSNSTAGKTGMVTVSGVDFTNYYPDPITMTISGMKTLTGREMIADEFNFQLIDSVTSKSIASAANNEEGEFTFAPSLRFTTADAGKTFTYYVREDIGAASHVTYDDTFYQLDIAVSRNGATLSAAYKVSKWTKGSDGVYTQTQVEEVEPDNSDLTIDSISFANTFEIQDASVKLEGTKNLRGNAADGLSAGEFTFDVFKADGEGYIVGDRPVTTGSNAADTSADANDHYSAPINFSTIYIPVSEITNANGDVQAETYLYYVVKEHIPGIDAGTFDINMGYDSAEYLVKVKVTYNATTGAMSAQVESITKDGATDDITFTNYQNPDEKVFIPAGEKSTVGRTDETEVPEGLRFSFRVVGLGNDAGNLNRGKVEATGTSAGDTNTGDTIRFTGLAYDADDVDETFYYLIEEVPAAGGNMMEYSTAVYGLAVTISRDSETHALTTSHTYYNISAGGETNFSAWTPFDTGDKVAFENEYSAYATLDITATKALTGADLEADEFDFRLQLMSKQDDGSYVVPAGTSTVNGVNGEGIYNSETKASEGKITFGTLIFTEAQLDEEYIVSTEDGITTYEYVVLISEIEPATNAIAGVTYTNTKYIAVIHWEVTEGATDAEDEFGDPYVEAIYLADESTDGSYTFGDVKTSIVFENHYRVTTGTSVTLEATKNLTGRFLRENEFEFTLERYAGMVEGWTYVTNASNTVDGPNSYTGTVSFTRYFNANTLDHMTFDKVVDGDGNPILNAAGHEVSRYTVIYRIAERNNGMGGVNYEEATPYYVEVVIEHDEEAAAYSVYSVNYYKSFENDVLSERVVDGDDADEKPDVIFKNKYSTGDITVTPAGTKELIGETTGSYTFGFEVVELKEGADGNYVPDQYVSGKDEQYSSKIATTGQTGTMTGGDSASINFGFITYNDTSCANCVEVEGVHSHYYLIRETAGSAPGITYTNDVYYLKVTLKDMGDGTVEKELVYYSDAKFTNPILDDNSEKVDEVKFTNHYGPGFVNLNLEVNKVVEVKYPEAAQTFALRGTPVIDPAAKYVLTGSEFDFEVYTYDPETGKEGTTAVASGTNGAGTTDKPNVAKVPFTTITYTRADLDGNKEGVFYYVIKELTPSDGSVPGVEIDDKKIYVTVTVRDDGYGNMEIKSVVFSDNDASTVDDTFVNTYEVENSVTVTLTAVKSLTGKSMEGEYFEFELSEVVDGVETRIGTVENDASGAITFPELTFIKPGTYTYKVRETTGGTRVSETGIYHYDDTVYTVTIEVWDDREGELYTVVTITDGENTVDVMEFENSYDRPALTVGLSDAINADKTVVGPNGEKLSYMLENYTFRFEVIDLQGNPVKDAAGNDMIGETDANGNITFPDFKFETAGEYHYLIREVVDPNYADQKITTDGSVWCVHIQVVYDRVAGLLKIYDDSTADGVEGVITHLYSVASHGTEGISAQVDENPIFVNDYDPADVSVTLSAKKLLEGRDLKNNEFTFRLLYDMDADGEPETIAAEARNNANGTVTFRLDCDLADMVNEEGKQVDEKTFAYTMVEVIPNEKLGGVDYSERSFAVTVTVTDNKAGALTASVANAQKDDNGVWVTGNTFTNTYSAKKTSAQITALKRMEGTKPLNERDYTFRLESKDDGKVYSATNDANGTIVFDTLEYTTEGVYTYTLKEVNPTVIGGGMTYDSMAYTVTVTVTDDLVGQLHATVAYTDADGNVYAIPVFTNTYKPDGADVTIEAHKTLSGKALTAGEFTFKLLDAEGVELDSVTNAANGTVTFKQFTFVAAGEYTFTISEVKGDNPGMTYDETLFVVTVTVTDEDYDGQLDAKVTYTKDGNAVNGKPEFRNSYTPDPVEVQISAEKDLTGKDLEAEEFSFKLVGNGKDLTAKNDADGKITFPVITITADDMVDENGNPVAEKSFEYTISEVKGDNPGMIYDASKYTATVIVTDDGNGNLTAEVEYTKDAVTISTEVPVFTNSYVPGSVHVTFEANKVLTGKNLTAGEFKFELKNSDGTLLATLTNDADGNIAFDTITYTDAKVYTYTLTEVKGDAKGMAYDDTVYTITVTVTDDGEGILTAETAYSIGTKAVEEITFTNVYTPEAINVRLKGTKDLTGRDQVAGEFSFEVRDAKGNLITTGTNTADGTIVFKDIEVRGVGETTLYVTEVEGTDERMVYDDYIYRVKLTAANENGKLVAAVTYLDGDIVFYNEYQEPDTPLTGDDSSAFFYAGLLGTSLLALAATLFLFRKKETL